MPLEFFDANGTKRNGYLALPATGKGPGILVLHAWWGLNDTFKEVCDRLAAEGFVAFAPDLHLGKIATTIDEAKKLMEERDFPAAQATAEAAVSHLRAHQAVSSKQIGAIGFSMGAGFALMLDEMHRDVFNAIVLVYGGSGADLAESQAAFQAHFAEQDEWEPMSDVRQTKGKNLELHVYPGVGHWFMETDRPENYNDQAAMLAWSRILEFLKSQSWK